jgi:hypothetical protein
VKPWTGSDVFSVIKAAIDARAIAPPLLIPADDFLTPPPSVPPRALSEDVTTTTTITPSGWRGNPDPTVVHDAPLLPANEHRMTIPAGVSKQDPGTPTPIALSGPVPTALPVM